MSPIFEVFSVGLKQTQEDEKFCYRGFFWGYHNVLLNSKIEVFIEALLGLDCRVSGRLHPCSMTRKMVNGRFVLPRIMEEVVSSLEWLSSVSHCGPMLPPLFTRLVNNGSPTGRSVTQIQMALWPILSDI